MKDPILAACQELQQQGGLRRLHLCLERPLPPPEEPTLVCHSFPVLQIVLSGVLPLRFAGIGGKIVEAEIGPGEGYFSLPWAWNTRDNTPARRMLMVRFQPDRHEYALSDWRGKPRNPPRWEAWHELRNPSNPTIAPLLGGISALAGSAYPAEALEPLLLRLGEALLECARLSLLDGPREVIDRRYARWRQITAHLEETLPRPVTREEVARIFRITPDHLTRLFRQYTGESFSPYISRLRIEHAQQLLRNGELSVKEVSRFCGFTSTSYFIKAFKRVTGKTPGGA